MPNRAWILSLCIPLVWMLSGCTYMPIPFQGDKNRSETSLDSWIDQDLVPYLEEQLSKHPRFKGEPLLVVRMLGANVQSDIDQLTNNIRARTFDTLLSTPGINLVWRPATKPWEHHRSLSEVACGDFHTIHYYIGIETKLTPDDVLQVSVRALDLHEGTWVSGFGRSWQARPTHAQRWALKRRQPDEYLRGLRPLPFTESQADLMAAYLAHNLSCLLRQQDMGGVVIYPEPPKADHPFFRTTLNLVGNYLARFREVRVTNDRNQANVILRGEAHPIHGGLHQVWVMTQFKEGGQHLAGADTEAYVRLDRHPSVVRRNAAPRLLPLSALPEPREPILSAFRLLTPLSQAFCVTTNPWALGERELGAHEPLSSQGCFALALEVAQDAEVFLINYNSRGRLIRLLPASCGQRRKIDRHIAAGDGLRFPPRSQKGHEVINVGDERGEETFYAIAVTDRGTARRLGRHLNGLSDGCERSRHITIGHRELDDWLSELDRLVQGNPGSVEWKSVHVRSVR